MLKPLRALFVEDSEPDTEELLYILGRAGFDVTWQRVETAAGLHQALREKSWDIIFCDQFLPTFSGSDALRIVRANHRDLPVIVVSGVVGDEAAVVAMKAGANDFFRKDRLARLGAAIDRELAEHKNRRERDSALVALQAAHQDAEAKANAHRQLEREKAEVDIERKNLRNLFREAPAIVAIVTGPDHLLEFSNPAHCHLLGSDKTGQTLRSLPQYDPKVLSHLDRVYQTGMTAHYTQMAVHTHNETRFLDFAFTARRNGKDEIDGVMILGTDVTEQLKARRAAEASSASKSAFLANMSHEIRTPLGAILGFSALLKETSLAPEEYNRYIDTINRNGKALTRIIDDILDLAKIEAGRLEIEVINFSLSELVTDVIALFGEKAKAKNLYLDVRFDAAIPTYIRSDPTRLRQVLFNIVGNAIKFTDAGGVHIVVTGGSRGGTDLQVSVEVQDTGCGLTAKQKARLFQPFTQADNTTTRQFGGTGLGLALAKRLCEALGGSITIKKSVAGRGSIFVVTFLASLPSPSCSPVRMPAARQAAQPKSQRLQNVRVLVVDDAADNQFLVKHLLTRSGASVEVASNGIEAVEKAMSGPHDVILMDIQMPEMDGYQAVAALHARGYAKPIIALTAHALHEERLRTKAAGFVGHLTKPLDQAELLDMVARQAGRLEPADQAF